MSAFGGKADIAPRIAKCTANDPKWTLKALERGDDIIFKQTPIIDRFEFRFHHSTCFVGQLNAASGATLWSKSRALSLR
jgi:hypothetical protein